jgi:diaminopimelate epimerase
LNLSAQMIPFVKGCAVGNDFLLIEGSLAPENISDFTRRICDRHDGVGADGVEWLFPHSSETAEARLINADGSPAEISGNGTRCVAAFLCDQQKKEKVTVQTGAGVKICSLVARHGTEFEFEMEMGRAEVGTELVLNMGRGAVRGIPVSMGNPHYVTFVEKFSSEWQREAAEIQRCGEFKQGVNVELVVPQGKNDISVRYFERGVGETRSSGTGSCAAAVATITTGRAESPVKIHTLGGLQTVRWEHGQVFLRGSARLVCRGEFFIS